MLASGYPRLGARAGRPEADDIGAGGRSPYEVEEDEEIIETRHSNHAHPDHQSEAHEYP